MQQQMIQYSRKKDGSVEGFVMDYPGVAVSLLSVLLVIVWYLLKKRL